MRKIHLPAIAIAWTIGLGAWSPSSDGSNALYAQAPRVTTKFQVDPFWPKPVPNDLIMGPGSGACVDKADHVFVIQRTADITKSNPNQADEFAPTMVEYDPDGNFVQM